MTAFPFDNSYARLPEQLFTRQAPTPVADPSLIAVNAALAARLGLDLPLEDPETLAGWFSGTTLPPGAAPLAQLYAGHQFGGWVPQLGDGRAVLLGEVVAPDGARFDIQLKGAGPTPYSRMGDGRAALGPVLREYLVSEAMAAIGLPTTRALAATLTGERVLRENGPLPGAVLTRVAASHIRVGTFQVLAARGDIEGLQALFTHTVARHYETAEPTPEALLDQVIDAQARLIAGWMGVGFIHGVMNTDNMTLSGETIDYGPCAFLDSYHPNTVFSAIDQTGRYAYANQPQIAVWNLAQLATALLPLMPDRDAAIDRFTEQIDGFGAQFHDAWRQVFAAKLGLQPGAEAEELAVRLLQLMAEAGADFTQTFRTLSGKAPEDLRHTLPQSPSQAETLAHWLSDWRAQIDRSDHAGDDAQRTARMQAANPALIPRNHRIEQAIAAATEGDFAPFKRLGQALQTPFADQPEFADLAAPPSADEQVTRTFCGT